MTRNRIAIALLLLILPACTSITGNVAREETIKIGWIGPLSGPSAALGIDSVVAAQMAVDEVNARGGVDGRRLELLVEDDQYQTARTVSAYNKLTGEGAMVIFMSTYGSVFALRDQAAQDGVIILDALDCDHEMARPGGSVFCIAPTTEAKGVVLAEQASGLGLQKIGIIYYNGDTFMPRVKDYFVQEFGEENIIAEAYNPGAVDFRTSLAKMQDQEIDGLLLLGYDELGIATLQARQLGFDGPILAVATVTSPGWQAAAKGTAEGTYFGFWDAPDDSQKYTEFTARFVERQGRTPIFEFATDATYDATLLVSEAMRSAPDDSTESLKAELLKVKDYEGVSGTLSFDEYGAAALPLSIHRLVDGQAQLIDGG